MKLTYKYLLFVVVLLFGTISMNAIEPIRWGVVGGMNLSTVKIGTQMRFGYHLGVKAEQPLSKNFYLESGLMYTRKGYNYELSSILPMEVEGVDAYAYSYITGRSNKNMLELPIHVGYKLAVHERIKLFASTGVYLGYGLSGRSKGKTVLVTGQIPVEEGVIGTDIPTMQQVFTYDDKVYDKEKRFDWGIGVKVGVEAFDKLQFSASYDWGMHKLYKETSEGNNRNLMFSLAYMFR